MKLFLCLYASLKWHDNYRGGNEARNVTYVEIARILILKKALLTSVVLKCNE